MSEARNRIGRPVAAAAAAVVLSLTASGCVTVHGELEIVPSTTKGQAARAVDTFVDAYNKAEKTYDADADAKYVTGALGAIDAAKLKAGRALNPNGNPKHVPLKLTDTQVTVPKKAGWPRWFVTNSETTRVPGYRWVMVFTRNAENAPWAVSYLSLFRNGTVPKFKQDKDGWAESVAPDASGLAQRPKDMGKKYIQYLKKGGDGYAPGLHTTRWRQTREKIDSRPGLTTQFIDESLNSGDYAPVALRTENGGALVFFTTRRYEKLTAFPGSNLPAIGPDVKALMKGEPKQSAMYGYVSGQAAIDPPGTSGKVNVVSRVEGITTAEGN
ncbi:hypothetical protein [Streptomyces endophyticus]|uniref:DUF8094 domain-containing protein n=1 Tax=Streptomyces endophyticus TaxID=714166 RepID=A0ABU6FFA9_9ACTN|nr:hypothetical protein [Streptomyces endophyticus]MEB8342740.1 hypothetical protein [Streptomyces endophyticus]